MTFHSMLHSSENGRESFFCLVVIEHKWGKRERFTPVSSYFRRNKQILFWNSTYGSVHVCVGLRCLPAICSFNSMSSLLFPPHCLVFPISASRPLLSTKYYHADTLFNCQWLKHSHALNSKNVQYMNNGYVLNWEEDLSLRITSSCLKNPLNCWNTIWEESVGS